MVRGFSLTSRLTFFFTGVAMALVLGLGWFFMMEADRHFMELDRAALLDKKRLIEEVLANASSAADARWRLDEASSHHHGLYVAVTEEQGAPLCQSSGFIAPRSAQPIPINGETPALQLVVTDGRELRCLSIRARPKHNAATDLKVTVAMDTAHHTQFLSGS